jgi:hypothetical protein
LTSFPPLSSIAVGLRRSCAVTEPPLEPKIEAAAAVLKGAISAVPFVGGLIAEVGNLYLNPLEKRKQQWMAEVGQAIDDIRRQHSLLPESLQSDERFISFLYQATILALKNHQRQKITALRNAIVSVAKPDQVSEDIAFQFLRYIDELSTTHFSMLACLDKHAGQFARMKTLERAYREFQSYLGATIERAPFRSFLHDLDARFLIRIGDLQDFSEYASRESFLLVDKAEKRPLEVTILGRSFLSFISRTEPQSESSVACGA